MVKKGKIDEKALDYAGKSGTAGNRPVFPLQMLRWSCNLPQERYNSLEPPPKKEIPVEKIDPGKYV
jgi:hypothetical protein